MTIITDSIANIIAELEQKGFTGSDASLEISLREYGLAWTEDDEFFTFIYGIKTGENEYGEAKFVRFDSVSFDKDAEPKKEWNWIKEEEWTEIEDAFDENLEDIPFVQIVNEILIRHGFENVFGSSWEGFAIS